MNWNKRAFVWGIATVAMVGAITGSGSAVAQSAGMEILTRGPVHEAFAETVIYDPTPGIIVNVEPPDLIEEVLPDQRPTGDNVVWIPGYWAWDDEQNDFLWISGIWRNLPPGREWIPGYWAPLDGRHQWTSGYWEDVETTQVSYLPEPPRSVEAGPNIPASSDDQTWIPGTWQYQEDRYAWRAGYWVDARPDWCWTPSYYRWTCRGYVHVNGYWDYPVARRGVIFAPVRFQRSYCSQPGFVYSPLAVISLSVFTNHLFLRPSYCHYYFGDYYEPRYRDRYHASYSYHNSRRGHDPIFAYNRWENRGDRNWVRERQNDYEYRRDNVGARPPRTWDALNARPMRDRERGDHAVASRYDQVVKSSEGRQRYQAVTTRERDLNVSRKKELQTFGRERQRREIASTRDKGKASSGVSRLQVNRSPVGAKTSRLSTRNGSPPKRLTDGRPATGVAASKSTDSGKTLGTRPGSGDRNKESVKGSSRNANPSSGRTATAEVMRNATRETRTQPGQRRDPAPSSRNKATPSSQARDSGKRQSQADLTSKRLLPSSSKALTSPSSKSRKAEATPQRKATPAPQRKATPAPQRQYAPAPQRKATPAPQRQLAPTPQRKAIPAPQRQYAPTPQRKAIPAPQRQYAPTPQRKATPAPQRQYAPTPQRKAAPAPQRQYAPAPQRKATPAPQRQYAPTPQRKATPAPQRQYAPTPQRKAAPAPQRQYAPTPQRKAAPAPQRQYAPTPQRKAAPAPQRRASPSPQRQSSPSISKGSSSTRTEEGKRESSDRGKKKR